MVDKTRTKIPHWDSFTPTTSFDFPKPKASEWKSWDITYLLYIKIETLKFWKCFTSSLIVVWGLCGVYCEKVVNSTCKKSVLTSSQVVLIRFVDSLQYLGSKELLQIITTISFTVLMMTWVKVFQKVSFDELSFFVSLEDIIYSRWRFMIFFFLNVICIVHLSGD